MKACITNHNSFERRFKMRAKATFYKDVDKLFRINKRRCALGGAIDNEIGHSLDVIVNSVADRSEWRLTDLLGRSMGVIRADSGAFAIEPDGKARETMKEMSCGPFASLDEALTAIETHTRGVCRRGAEVVREPETGPAEDAGGSAGVS